MTWQIQQTSDYGSGTPAVARTFLQGAPIVDAFAVDDRKREHCKGVLLKLQGQMIRCHSERDPLAKQIAAGMAAGATPQSRGAVNLPGVLNLQTRCEAFLQSAKLAIRESARLAEPFYVWQYRFDHRFDRAKKWASATFGPDDHITRVFTSWEPFVVQVCAWRDAVDHPHTAGELITTNFRMDGDRLVAPTWRIKPITETGKDSAADAEPIVESMDAIIENVVRLSENILGALYHKHKAAGSPLVLIQIPEAKRNPACPIRFRLGLPEELEPAPNAN